MSRLPAAIQRKPLLAAALLLALVKSIQFAVDSTLLFYNDSGAFILNALGRDFIPERSYVYAGLIRVFAVPLHSLRAIVAMQVVMGGLTAWLLVFALVRFLNVRASIAILAGLVFALDPMQIVYERMLMTEASTLLAMAVFLLAGLRYLQQPSLRWLVILSFLGTLLVSLRLVYLPLVAASSVLFPAAVCFSSGTPPRARRLRLLTLALAISCGSTMLFHSGYRELTGWLAGREPAYQYKTGFFLVAGIAPIVSSRDSDDPRVAEAVVEQNKSSLPLSDASLRPRQLWYSEGFVARLRSVLHGDERAANKAAESLARYAIVRNPLGYLRLGLHTYFDYWRGIRRLRWSLPWENGAQPGPVVTAGDVGVIRSAFGADVSNQHLLRTPSRRYHVLGRRWCLFLLVSPFFGGLALWMSPENPKAVALFFF